MFTMTIVPSEDTKDTKSREIRENFSIFLKEFINRTALIQTILDHMIGILVRIFR